MWKYVLNRQEFSRMALGCGDETGDLLGWQDLKSDIIINVAIVKPATCKYGKGKECVIQIRKINIRMPFFLCFIQ